MAMKIEIISKESIKPSFPTPSLLKEHKLSSLDQFAPRNYTPLIFFYPMTSLEPDQHLHISDNLKKSLAQTLTLYYPIAGTLVEASLLECNDKSKGVEFSEAQISWKMSEVTEEPDNIKILHQLLPFEPFSETRQDCILGVRFNVFNGGGIAISLCMSHRIFDGSSSSTFAYDWAATCRGVRDFTPPGFDSVDLFPPVEIHGKKHHRRLQMEETVTKRFVFEKSDIDFLKKQAVSDSDCPPSRVVTVSAFIWKRFMVLQQNTEAKRFAALHAVNLRGRMDPPLSGNSFGNLWWIAVAEAPVNEERDYACLVTEIRKAIKGINGDYVKETIQDVGKCLGTRMEWAQQVYSGEVEMCKFTSWCGFPVYETDFGWGKPEWVCSPGMPYKNVVVLFNTRDGEGIEAWVNLDEKDMPLFERDPEILSFTSSK